MTTSLATGLRCRECHAPQVAGYVCNLCFGPLEVTYDYHRAPSRTQIANGPPSMWRYAALLPSYAPFSDPVDLGAGFTPLRPAPRLAEELGLAELYLKDDTRNPTGSFKDRVVSVALSAARALGYTTAACASTGNLATSLAAHAAHMGWPSLVIIPADLERSKIAMSAIFGGTVLAVSGSYDDVNRLCIELADENPGYAFVNINTRPYYAEGSKTIAYEICEQLGWKTPGQVVIPIASGSQFTKIIRGFNEFIELGLATGPMPTFFGAQPEGCSPVATARAGALRDFTPVRPTTLVRSLAIGNPADGGYVLDYVAANNGDVVSVPDDETLECVELIARTTGIFAELAGGVVVASLRKMIAAGSIDPTKSTVAVISGHGLKTLDAFTSASPTATITPSLAAAQAALSK